MITSAFISYCHADNAALGRLHIHFAPLKRDGILVTWSDHDILAGDPLDDVISEQLEGSQVFVALLSPDYLASTYCYDKEFARARQLAELGKMRIVPVILEPCDWTKSPFQKFKALPKDGRPISDYPNQNTAYLEVVNSLRDIIGSIGQEPPKSVDKVARARPTKTEGGSGKFFAPGTVLASVGQPGEQDFRFEYDRIAYMRVHPTFAIDTVTRARAAKIFDERRPVALSAQSTGAISSYNEFGPITFHFDGKASITSLTQCLNNGQLWGLSGEFFAPAIFKSHQTGASEAVTVLPIVTFEKAFLQALRNYVKVEGALGLRPPYDVVLGLGGLKGVYLSAPTLGPFGNGGYTRPIRDNEIERTYTLATDDDGAIKTVLRAFFCDLYDLALVTRDELWTKELLIAHDLPSL